MLQCLAQLEQNVVFRFYFPIKKDNPNPNITLPQPYPNPSGVGLWVVFLIKVSAPGPDRVQKVCYF